MTGEAKGIFGGMDIDAAAMVFERFEDPARTLRQLVAMVEATKPRRWPPKSLDELLADIREYAEQKVEHFDDPLEDDVMPMQHFEGAEKTGLFFWPGEPDEPYVYETVGAELCRLLHVRAYAGTQAIWMAPKDAGVRPADAPNRIEGISVFGTDGLRFVIYVAQLQRDDDGARLEKWQVLDEGPVQEAQWVVSPAASMIWNERLARATRCWLVAKPINWWTAERRSALDVMRASWTDRLLLDALHKRAADPDEKLVDAFALLYGLDLANPQPNPEVVELARREDLWDYMPEGPKDSPARDVDFD